MTDLNAVDPGTAADLERADCRACKHGQRYPKFSNSLGCIHPNVAVRGHQGQTIAVLASVIHATRCKGEWKE